MAMGTRKQRERQEPLWYRTESPEAPGHPFYRRLNDVLEREGFDRFCEARCREFYHEKLGRPDSLTLREFLRIGLDERTPDHVTISRTQRLIGAAADQQVFGWVLKRLARGGLMKGKTIGVDSTTLEANAAMKSIVRRDTQESYSAYVERLAEAEGVEATDAAAVRRMDRKRSKKIRNEEWMNPNDPEADWGGFSKPMLKTIAHEIGHFVNNKRGRGEGHDFFTKSGYRSDILNTLEGGDIKISRQRVLDWNP